MNPTDAIYQKLNQSTKRDYESVTLHERIDSVCRRSPNAIAVLSGDQEQTYGDLQRKSDRLARYLNVHGVGKGDLVGLCCNRDIDLPAFLLGIMKSGAGYVPLDPDYPAERLLYMVKNSGLKHTIAHQSQKHLTAQFGTPATIVDPNWSQISNADDGSVSTDPRSQSTVSDVAYVIYTSGSTGKPKGVVVQHSAVVNFLNSMVEWPGFGSNDRLLATTTLSFDISVVEMFLPLVTGGSVAVVDRATAKDMSALSHAIERFDINFMQATPAMWRMIIESDFVGRPDMKFVSAGEPLPPDLVDPLIQRCGELWNLYGPTETTVYSTGKHVLADDKRVLIGKPFANTQLYIVDEHDQLCPVESPGELLIAGDGVTLGYLDRPELNAEKFVQWNGRRVYRTGDLARLTVDGEIDHMGRIDSQIKLNGHRIELGEIDAAMAKSPGVRQAATVLREDRPGDQRLVGYLLTAEGVAVNPNEVRQAISGVLPNYMVPERIVTIDEFKYTPSGKLDRKAFPPPSTVRPDLEIEFVPPKTEREMQLASIWSDVLSVDRIGIYDNFLHLGGNSIRAVSIVARIEDELGITASPGEFFDNPTIDAFLRFVEEKNTLLDQVRVRGHERASSSDAFAIVGMAARMPGARDLEEYWKNLVEGRESIRFFTADELDPTLDSRDTSACNYVPARGIIDDAEYFDARFFGLPPRFAELTDPQQRILLELSWSALEDAGVIPSQTKESIGIWAGSYSTTYFTKNILTNPELVREIGEFNAGVYNEKDYIATRVAHALDLKGPAVNVNTACSTSLVAVIEACKSLRLGDCDVALAGGASVTFPQQSGHLHQEGSIFSPDGHCRPFDAQAGGTLFSDGAGVVVVKRLEDAIENQDRIYAVVKGYGINNDGGQKASFSAPSIKGQAGAIAMAHAMSGFEPETISYVEAHGTATPLGDPIEVNALRLVFESKTEKKQFCALGSVKSNIGHTVAAAGIAGLIKVAMSMHRNQIPATLHYKSANPQIQFETSPFYVCDSLRAWDPNESPRRAGVSAFGVGGTNAHMVLEDAPQLVREPDISNDLPATILPVSAVTEKSLMESIGRLSSQLTQADQTLTLSQVASTLQFGRENFAFRAVVVADSLEEAVAAMTSQDPTCFAKRKASAAPRDVVFMFPGQGAQYVRMGQSLYQHSEVFRSNLDQCAGILAPFLHRDLREVLFPSQGDEQAANEILKNTRFTQPALFALGYSMAQVWIRWGIKPDALIGHSIGEFVAACIAGVFSLEDGLRMIAQRGQMMQELPGGSMMSVRMPGHEVERLLWGDMSIGSFNGPQLCVVSGPTNQVAQLQTQLEESGVICRHLHTSHAFHSPMMNELVEPFAQFVSQFELSPPAISILSTVTGDWMRDEQATDPSYWANHLLAPVRFSDAVSRIWDSQQGDPTRVLVELGPRKTLSTLAKQHASDPKKQIAIATLSDNAEGRTEWNAMLRAVGELWLSGVEVEWSLLSSDGKQKRALGHVSLPTYAFDRKRYFIDPRATNEPACDRQQVLSDNPQDHCAAPIPLSTSPVKSHITHDKPTVETSKMSRIPNLVACIERVFEDTSGFELQEFDGDTTFFEMGLDSLILTQTAAALCKETCADITFRQLLEETPTVDSLAKWLDESLPEDRFQPSSKQPSSTEEATLELPNPSVSTDVGSQSNLSPLPLSASASSVAVNDTTTPISPTTPIVPPGSIESIVQMQMQLMQQQLQLLGGQRHAATTQIIASQSHVSEPDAFDPTTLQCSGSESVVPQSTLETGSRPDQTQRSQADPLPTPSRASGEEITGESEEDGIAPKAKRFATVKLNEGDLNPTQQKALDEIIRMNSAMMPKSKAYAQQYRKCMADPRTVSGFRPNLKEITHPIVVDRSKGVTLWDIDGNEYIDFTCGFGSNFLGHTHDITVQAITEQVQKDYAIGPQSPLAGEVAQLFCELTGHERMAFSNTGSEAVLGCTRLARNATGRDLIVMFNGDYHGILDEVIVRGSKKRKSFPAATGIPKAYVGNTLVLDYGTDESLEIIRDNLDRLAAILVEPVQSRTPELQPREFLKELERMTANEPTALIFDEVISGFRIGLGGAQEYFGVKADLASYGKVVGGGMPIGVVAGRAKYMDGLDGGNWNYGDDSRPEAGMTYFAGTFVRHPLTLAASKAILSHLKQLGPAAYQRINELADYLGAELNQVFRELGAPLSLAHFGSLFKIQFAEELVYSEVFFAGLRRRGMHLWDHRPCLLTLAHEKHHVDELVSAVHDTVVECQRHGFMPGEGYRTASLDFDPTRPPQKGARLGKDENKKPAWFIPDSQNPGQYVQVGFTV